MADIPQGGTPGQNAQILITALWKDVTAEGRAALINFLQKAPTNADELQKALNGLQAAFGKLPDVAKQVTKANEEQEKSVAALVAQYKAAMEGLSLYTSTADKLQGKLAEIEKSQGAAAAGASAENEALALAAVGMAQYGDKLSKLPPGMETLVRTMAEVRAEAAAQSKGLSDDGVALTSLVSKYNAAAQAAETYRTAAVGIQARQVSAESGAGGQTPEDVQRLNDAYELAIKVAQEYEGQLAKLPPGVQELSKQLEINKQALLDQAAAAKQVEPSLSQLEGQYEKATKGAAEYAAVAKSLGEQQKSMQGSGKASADEIAAVSQAQSLASRTSQEYQAQVDKLGPSVAAVSKAHVEYISQQKAAADALKSGKKPIEDTASAFKALTDSVFGVGRGLASSLIGFSLIAGGTVAVGHVVGNAIEGAIAAYEKLQQEILTIAQLNPKLNTDTLNQQINDMENRLGILSENIVAVYKATAGATQGSPETSLFVGETAQAAQANRQDYLAWAQAITQTMQAYNVTVADTTHLQDVLTLAMQNSQGQGSALLQLWGSVTKAASGMNTDLNQSAAAMTVVATHGGDLQENMRALKGGFDALITPGTVAQLSAMGVQLKVTGNQTADLLTVLGQLKDLTQGWSPADQSELLRKLFQDRDVVNVMRTLLNNYDELKQKTNDFANSQGAAAQAQATFTSTTQAHEEKMMAYSQAVQENIGKWADWKMHIAGIIDLLETANKDAQDRGGVNGKGNTPQDQAAANESFGAALAQGALGGGQFGVVLPDPSKLNEVTRNIEDMNKAVSASGGYFNSVSDSVSRVTSTFGPAVTVITSTTSALNEHKNALGLTSQEYKTLVDWQGKVLDQSSSLQVQLKGVSSDIQSVVQQASALSKGGAFGGFGSAEEQQMANIAEYLKTAIPDAQTIRGEIQKLAELGIAPESVLGQLMQQVLDNKLGTIRNMVAEAKQLSVDIVKNSPEGKLAYAGYEHDVASRAATAAINAEQQRATEISQGYSNAIRELTNQQKDLQRAMRENATPELAAAYKELTDKTKEQTDKTYEFDVELNKLRGDLLDVKDKAKGILDPAKGSLEAAQKALRDFDQATQEGVDKDTVKLHQLQDEQKRVKEEQEGLVHSAQAVYDAAEKAYAGLQEDMRLMDESYKNQEGDLQRSIELLDRLNKQKLDGLKDEVDKLSRALDDLKQKEAEELRPFEDQLVKEKIAVQAAQDAIDAISKKYAYLNKLQAEYDGLKQRELQMQQQQDLLNKRDSVENLVARLASAKKGTSDYLELSQELVKARNEEALSTKEYNLQNQIAAGQAAEKVEMDAAKQRLAQAQAEYNATQRQIDAIKQRYTVEERAIQDSMRLKQQEYDDAKKKADQDHNDLEIKLQDLKEEQRQYDETQQHSIDAQKAIVDTAKQALSDAKEVQYAANLAQQKIVDTYTTNMRDNADQAKLWHDGLQDTVNFANDNYEGLKKFWDDQTNDVQHHIDRVTLDKTNFETVIGQEVKTAQENYNKIKEAIQVSIDRLGDQIDVLRDTATEHEQTAQREIEAERKKQQAIEDTWAAYNAYLQFLKATGQFTGDIPPMHLPGVTAPFNPNPDKRPPYFHSPTVSPPAPTGPQPNPNQPAVGGKAVQYGPQSLGQTPVSSATRAAIQGNTTVNAHFGNITVQMVGTGRNGAITERDAYESASKIVRGMRKALRDQYQVDMQEVGDYYG